MTTLRDFRVSFSDLASTGDTLLTVVREMSQLVLLQEPGTPGCLFIYIFIQ